jgi:uncharacterized protein (TIGR03546 family)
MISWTARQFRFLKQLLTTNDSPRQLALGVAFGMLLAVVPKGNLLALAIATVFLALRVNLGTGMLCAAGLSFVAGWIDPLAHGLGWALLNAAPLRPLWTELYNLPLVPWTRFNNTVVLGGFLLGLAAFYPTYRLALPAFVRWRAYLARRHRSPRHSRGDTLATAQVSAETQRSAALRQMRWRRLQRFVEDVEGLSSPGRAA